MNIDHDNPIITFKEETLECVARGFEVKHRQEETDV
jgi:hypothetical protein